MSITEQARRTIDALRAAGLARGDFRVRTEVHMRRPKGERPFREYGNAQVCLLCPAWRVLTRLDAILAHGLGVRVDVDADGNARYVTVDATWAMRGVLLVSLVDYATGREAWRQAATVAACPALPATVACALCTHLAHLPSDGVAPDHCPKCWQRSLVVHQRPLPAPPDTAELARVAVRTGLQRARAAAEDRAASYVRLCAAVTDTGGAPNRTMLAAWARAASTALRLTRQLDTPPALQPSAPPPQPKESAHASA